MDVNGAILTFDLEFIPAKLAAAFLRPMDMFVIHDFGSPLGCIPFGSYKAHSHGEFVGWPGYGTIVAALDLEINR